MVDSVNAPRPTNTGGAGAVARTMLQALLATLVLAAPDPQGRPVWDPAATWSVTAGVLRWKDKELDDFSTYGRKDKLLDKTLDARGVPDDQRALLIDKQATAAAVLDAVGRQVVAAPPGTTFVFYFTGHGVRDATGQLVLTTTDTDTRRLESTGLRASALVPLYALRGARDRVVLLSDACTSGDLAAVAWSLLALGVPTVALTSAASQSESTGNWTFSQTIIDTLRGRALLDTDEDGAVTLAEAAAEARGAMRHREGQPFGFVAAGVPLDLVLAEAAPWPKDLAALDVSGERWRRGDWVLVMRNGEEVVGRVLGAERRPGRKGTRGPLDVRLRLAFFGYADETLGWAREDRAREVAFESHPVGARLAVEDDEEVYEAVVRRSEDGLHFVHYEGYEESEDEWVTPDQILGTWADYQAERAE